MAMELNCTVANMDKISAVPKVKTLVLRDNLLKAASNLEACRDLWSIDLANNRIDHLDGTFLSSYLHEFFLVIYQLFSFSLCDWSIFRMLHTVDLTFGFLAVPPSPQKKHPPPHLSSLGTLCLVFWTGFERFIALGNVQLSGNNIGWAEVFKLKHLQIMNLSLFGNPVEEDWHYRQHIIDILPRVWSLDGQIITAAERQRVKAYFDSVETKPDLRRKRPRTSFIRSSLRNIELTGVFGTRTVQIMKRFPSCVQHTLAVDRARVAYMAGCLEAELLHAAWFRGQLDEKVMMSDVRGSHLESILATAADQRNMLLLLLLSSLVFSIPSELMRATLEMTKLGTIHRVDTMKYFMVTPEIRVQVVTLLMSAAEIDRRTLIDGGLYPKLFRCLRNASQQLFRLIQGDGSSMHAHSNQQPLSFSRRHNGPNLKRKLPPPTERFGNLLAVELSQLLCLVPAFIGYIGQVGDQGLIKLLEVSTKDDDVYPRLMALMLSLEQEAAASSARPGVATAPPASEADAAPPHTHSAGGEGIAAAESAGESAAKPDRGGEAGIEATWEVYRRITSFLLERIEKDIDARDDGGSAAPRGPSVFESEAQPVQPSRGKTARSRVVGTRHQALPRVSTAVGPRRRSHNRPGTANSGTYKGKRARAQTAPATRRKASISIGDMVRKDDGTFARVIGTPHSSVALLALPSRSAGVDGHQASPEIENIPLAAFRRDASGQWICDVVGAAGELSISSVKPFSVGSSTSFVIASSSFVDKMNAVKLDAGAPQATAWQEVEEGSNMAMSPPQQGWHQYSPPRHPQQDTRNHLQQDAAAVAAASNDEAAEASLFANGNRSAIIDAQRIVLPDHLLTSDTRVDSPTSRIRVKSARAPRSGSATIVIRTRGTVDPHNSAFSDDDGSLFGSDDEGEDDEILWVASRPGSATPGLTSRRGSQTPAPDSYGTGHTSPPTASLGAIPSVRPGSARSRPGSAPRDRPGSARSRPGSAPRDRPGSARNRPSSARNRPGSAPRSRPHAQRRLSEFGGREASDELINELLRTETPTQPLQVSVQIDYDNADNRDATLDEGPAAVPIMMPFVEAERTDRIALQSQEHVASDGDGDGGGDKSSAASEAANTASSARQSTAGSREGEGDVSAKRAGMTRVASITKIEFSQALAGSAIGGNKHHSLSATRNQRKIGEAATVNRVRMVRSPTSIAGKQFNFHAVNHSPGKKLNRSPSRRLNNNADFALKSDRSWRSPSPSKQHQSLSRSQMSRNDFVKTQPSFQVNSSAIY